jgi:hypothetical protein
LILSGSRIGGTRSQRALGNERFSFVVKNKAGLISQSGICGKLQNF